MIEHEWNQFGWQGISFVKPKQWELGTVEGNENGGYVRLDDRMQSRMELRWQEQPGISLEKVLARYVRGMVRRARRQRIDFKVTSKRDYQTKTIKGKYLVWESGSNRVTSPGNTWYRSQQSGISNGVNLVVRCKNSSRLLVARVFGETGEDIEKKAKKIFNSLGDHSDDGELPWSVFDFGFTTPAELTLSTHRFLSGHLRFDFLRGGDSFIYERLSIANILLKGKTLSQWVMEFRRSQFSNVDIEVGYPREGSSEEGIYTIGREHGKIRVFKRRFFKSLLWHCEKTNHIFGVAELVRKRERSCLDRLVSGMKCH